VLKAMGSFTHTDRGGSTAMSFNGRLKGRALKAGAYVLSAVPALGSLTGARRTANFKVT
jgi:hypothetical protein